MSTVAATKSMAEAAEGTTLGLACQNCDMPVASADELLPERVAVLDSAVYTYQLEDVCGADPWCYSATNAHDHRFDVARFRLPPGEPRVQYHGEPTADMSWFPPYEWRQAACRRCLRHLGWAFSEAGTEPGAPRVVFLGLVLTHLRERSMRKDALAAREATRGSHAAALEHVLSLLLDAAGMSGEDEGDCSQDESGGEGSGVGIGEGSGEGSDVEAGRADEPSGEATAGAGADADPGADVSAEAAGAGGGHVEGLSALRALRQGGHAERDDAAREEVWDGAEYAEAALAVDRLLDETAEAPATAPMPPAQLADAPGASQHAATAMLALAEAVLESQGRRADYADFVTALPAGNPFDEAAADSS